MNRSEPGRLGLVGLDWGTSSLRAWLLSGDGQVMASRRRAVELVSTTADDPAERAANFGRVLDDVCGDWLEEHPDLPVVACGMVGSASGWRDAGYLDVPSPLRLAADDLVEVRHGDRVVRLVPGLRQRALNDVPGDVLRGEETQLIGVLESVGATGPLLVVLPGTHTKWVLVENRTVVSFTTAMTGELFAVLLRHTLLARTAVSGERDDRAFARGLARGRASDRGLAAELFGARALVLEGLLQPPAVPDYVSGLLIADELRSQLPRHPDSTEVVLCGADLCRRYATAFAAYDVTTQVLDEDVTARGLWTVATAANLLDRHNDEPNGAAST